MATTYDNASLVMIPSGIKDGKAYSIKPTDGSGDFTFSRGTDTATRVNSSGLIEKERANLLLQSNTFDTTWTNNNSTETSGQSGYDGTNNAWLLNSSGSGSAYVAQSVSLSGVKTLSIYAKAGTADWVIVQMGGGTASYAWFDLSSGAVGTSVQLINSEITSVGGGWYKCSITGANSNTSVNIYISNADNSTSTSSGDNIYIQDAMLNQGLVAQPYIETTTAAVYEGITDNLPRLDYSGGASCPSLLLEPSRTNADPNSEYLANKPIVTNVSVTTNSTTSPEGVVNASTITNNTTSGQHQLTDNTFSVTSGTDYTMSLFLKYNDAQYVRLQFGGTPFGSTNWQNFDVLNGTKGSNGGGITSADASIEDYGNGWYRCILTADATATGSNGAFQIRILEDDNTSDVPSFAGTGLSTYAYGAQFESGSYPTSYIPTYGTSASRAEDYSDNAGDSSVFNDTEGVLYLESSWLSNELGTSTIAISDGSNSNRIILGYIGADDDLYCTSIGGGSSPSLMRYDVGDITTNHKIAIKYKANDFAFWVDGVERGTQSSGTTPVGLNELSFSSGAGGSKIFGNMKQILYFPTALTDAELAALTTL